MSASENSSLNGKSEEGSASLSSHAGAADVYTPHFGVTHSRPGEVSEVPPAQAEAVKEEMLSPLAEAIDYVMSRGYSFAAAESIVKRNGVDEILASKREQTSGDDVANADPGKGGEAAASREGSSPEPKE